MFHDVSSLGCSLSNSVWVCPSTRATREGTTTALPCHFQAIHALLTLCWHYVDTMLTLCWHNVDTMLTSFATFKHPLGPASPLKSPALWPQSSLFVQPWHDNDNFVAQNLKVSFRRNLTKTAIAPTRSTPSTSRSLMIFAVAYTGRIRCSLACLESFQVSKDGIKLDQIWERHISPFVRSQHFVNDFLAELMGCSRFVGDFAARAAKTVFCASLKSKSSHAVSTSMNFASAWVQYFPV